MKKNNNAYVIIGIGVRNANWNAGWDKLPKRDGMDIIKGSSYALQYCIKNQWNNLDKRVFGIKTMQKDGTCTTLNQRYTDLFNVEDKKPKAKEKDEKYEDYLKRAQAIIEGTRNNLLSCRDILNFGVAYTGENSMHITGIVQFTDGINKYEDTNIIEEKILSPYGNPKNEGATTNTNGTKYTTDEAHYVYDGSIFPKEYDKYICEGFEGYTEEDYEDFKETSLIAVSNYNSKAKAGCKNEFAMFIDIKDEYNYLLDLNNLQDYVEVTKEDKVIYDLTKLKNILGKVMEKIKNIEIYYNPRTIDITGMNLIKKYDLITRNLITK